MWVLILIQLFATEVAHTIQATQFLPKISSISVHGPLSPPVGAPTTTGTRDIIVIRRLLRALKYSLLVCDLAPRVIHHRHHICTLDMKHCAAGVTCQVSLPQALRNCAARLGSGGSARHPSRVEQQCQ